MTKCRKSFMPECEYFVAGGCASPFNCSYKAENESITTATSCNLYSLATDKDKEISRLQAEVAELRARLECSIEFPCKVGDTIYYINPYKEQPKIDEFKVRSLCKDNFYGKMIYIDNGEFFFVKTDGLFFTRAEAEAWLKKLTCVPRC